MTREEFIDKVGVAYREWVRYQTTEKERRLGELLRRGQLTEAELRKAKNSSTWRTRCV